MKTFILKISFNLLLLCSCVYKGNGQNIGCIDSISFNQFFPSYFEVSGSDYYPQRDAADNIYLSGGTAFGGPNNYWSIIKFNTANQLLWYKNYKVDFLSVFRTVGELHDIEPNGNLLFSTGTSNPYKQIISKADNGGNLLWSKIIKHGADPNMFGGFNKPVMDNNGELYCNGSFNDDINKPVIISLDAVGNLKWAKKYQYITVPKFHLIRTAITSQNSNTLVLAVQYYYNADIETDPAARFGLQLVKISKTDGTILQQTSFMYYNNLAGTVPNRAYLQKLRYSSATKKFILDLDESGFGIRNRMFTLFDENLNLVKTTYFTSAPKIISSIIKVSIGSSNEIVMSAAIQAGTPQRLLYTAIDNNLNIVSQKSIDLTTIGFPNRNFNADLAYKNNGILNFQIATYTNNALDYLFLFDHSPFYNNISPCLGKDSAIYNPVPIYVYPVINPTIEEAGTVPLQITNQFPDFPSVDFVLPKTEVCKTVSICDTIKLFGTKYHCLSNPIDSFKIYRNPLCVRKTNWQVDTTAIKILSQNDTNLYVQYLQPYRGKIKVGFGGCSLADSLDIEVYNAQTGVNLGNDTMNCPGKTITLYAGKGFKTYQWQNNTALDSLIATQAGTYHVTAYDSCGNIFKDTLIIAHFDVVLKTDYTGRLCPADTISFNLPTNLYNYNWTPTANSTLINFTWRLFPRATTTYSITGERLPGCTVTDTVLLNVKPNCLPDYIYFPTAFTPDGNMVNDIYKSGINGHLLVYEFMIFNRYGQPVFKTTDPTKGWDGRFKNDSKPLTGSYVWTCKYQFLGRRPEQEQGSFVLIR